MTKEIEKVKENTKKSERKNEKKIERKKTKEEEEEKCLWESKVCTRRLPHRHCRNASINSNEDGIACAKQQS